MSKGMNMFEQTVLGIFYLSKIKTVLDKCKLSKFIFIFSNKTAEAGNKVKVRFLEQPICEGDPLSSASS